MYRLADTYNIVSINANEGINIFDVSVAESADLTDEDLAGVAIGSVIDKDGLYYLMTENGAELLGEDTLMEEVSPFFGEQPVYLSVVSVDNYDNASINLSNTSQPFSASSYSKDYTTLSTNSKSSTKSTRGIVPVGSVLVIGGVFYLVVKGGIQMLGEGDLIVNSDTGKIDIYIDQSSHTNITNIITYTMINNTKTYIYNEGNKVINNYTPGEIVRLDITDYQGFTFNDQSFFINSGSGQLEIQDSRDKFIGYSDSNNNIIAYSYMASGGGDVDGRGKNQAEILIGADNQNNQIFAGNGGSSLWGGNGGADTLTGGDGYDEFFFAIGSGGDVIQNASSNDLINLLGVRSDQISEVFVSTEQVHINFTSGEFLQVKGNNGIGYRLENQTYVCNQSTCEWSTK